VTDLARRTRKCRRTKPDLPHSSRSVRSSNKIYAFSNLEPVSTFNRFSDVPPAMVCVSHPDHLPAANGHLPNFVCKTDTQRTAAQQVPLGPRAAPRRCPPRRDTQGHRHFITPIISNFLPIAFCPTRTDGPGLTSVSMSTGNRKLYLQARRATIEGKW
jgi:hypothetical protein